MKRLGGFILFIFLLCSVSAVSQTVMVNTWLDTNYILIGEQIKFTLEVVKNKDVEIQLPAPDYPVSDKIEVIRFLGVDSTSRDGKDVITQQYLVSAYDSGTFNINSLPVAMQFGDFSDTIHSSMEMLHVTTLPVDMEKGIYDIKSQYEAPVTLMEIIQTIIRFLPFLLILAAIIVALIIYFRRKQQNRLLDFFRKKPEEPHVIALRELEKLKEEKLWQQGLYKAYYSRLSDILRRYYENRFDVRAMEMVSDEVYSVSEELSLIGNEYLEKLNHFLKTSDLVKFAKATPLPDENDDYWKLVLHIVESTIEEKEQNDRVEDEDDIPNDNEVQQIKNSEDE